MDTDRPEYQEQLRKYLEAVGPVQGSGMAATWAWKVRRRNASFVTSSLAI